MPLVTSVIVFGVTKMIDAVNLTKKFGDVTAVDGLTFHVAEGEVFGFLGPNGAGKTTTVRMLCCLIARTSGEATIAGYDTGNDADSLKIRKMIGFMPENVGLYGELSAYRNLDFYARLYDRTEQQRKESIERLLRLLGLWEKKDQPVGNILQGNETESGHRPCAGARPRNPVPG